ncbi:hypothetical protein chiPu_0017419 [Chiloscyllium punctatum]|uniref:Uncharacterized protein n=1 Tax=Chiloscyllium punctatum TaxID=137246 RepID=A0A401RFV3_CHIPU|nr:hypothetical protein [Chiloscyllium punctatum]
MRGDIAVWAPSPLCMCSVGHVGDKGSATECERNGASTLIRNYVGNEVKGNNGQSNENNADSNSAKYLKI